MTWGTNGSFKKVSRLVVLAYIKLRSYGSEGCSSQRRGDVFFRDESSLPTSTTTWSCIHTRSLVMPDRDESERISGDHGARAEAGANTARLRDKTGSCIVRRKVVHATDDVVRYE